ncbi:glycosyltransferase [Fulvivirgaceae bacterium BMA10]|uniref:Glycosyltransferase n=1 Tax=Splendidivirga corallicola TaxID=3051826 RepID=A0ABT8KQF0_9BACT|nr:glycosyltransferase [Fulvivirgaceae bacterium BMA10]
MKKELVILTDNFGLNFSGGAIATCRIFEPIQEEFSGITVIAKRIGKHPFRNLAFLPYKNLLQALKQIKKKRKDNVVFYGDFYMTYFFILARVPFYFTYHDNWPEQGRLDQKNFLNSLFYIPIYRWIIKKALWVFSVSNFKLRFISKITNRTNIIRNGINSGISKSVYIPPSTTSPLRIIMAGNVDDRKFGLAKALFQIIEKKGFSEKITIDIYGNITDEALAKQLSIFPFVSLRGFYDHINFEPYDLFLSTSKIENLSISICEALLNYTPVIAFDVGGLNEVISHQKNGVLVPYANLDKMFDWIILIQSKQIRFDFTGQDLTEFDWNIAAKKYQAILIA